MLIREDNFLAADYECVRVKTAKQYKPNTKANDYKSTSDAKTRNT